MGIGKLFVGLKLFLADRKDISKREKARAKLQKCSLSGKKKKGWGQGQNKQALSWLSLVKERVRDCS